MGRSLPAVTQLIFREIEEVKSLYEGLRRSDQLELDRLFESVIQHKAALANTGSLLPLEVMFILTLLEEHKRNNRVRYELYQEVQQLRKELNLPGQIVDEELHRLAD
jgi:hypothetical protein